MRLYSIDGNSQRLDGGAMFGNAPKALWSQWFEPDELNRIPLACRALLIDTGDRKILCETGIGLFFEPKMRQRFGIQEDEHMLLKNLEAAGFEPDDITDVVLSHLHFDHAGGLLTPWSPNYQPQLIFSKAKYYVSQECWDRALNPHFRDRASFIPELQPLLEGSGRLVLLDRESSSPFGDAFEFRFSDGHTPGLMLLMAKSGDKKLLFMGDLVPGAPWVHLPITMGYDRYPELLIEEKTRILNELFECNGTVFFTHDPHVSMARIVKDERGRMSTADKMTTLEGFVF